jgi:hypothetical protein
MKTFGRFLVQFCLTAAVWLGMKTAAAATITLVGIDEVNYSFGGSGLAPNPVKQNYFGDHVNPHKGGYNPASFGGAEDTRFAGLAGYNFTNSALTVAAERSVSNGAGGGRNHGAADVKVRGTFKVTSTNGKDNVDIYLTSILDGFLKATVNTGEVSDATAVGTFRTPTVDRYYQEKVTNDGVNTPQYTWSIYDGTLPPDQRPRNVTTPGDGFLGPLGTQTNVYYSSGELPFFLNARSGTHVSVYAYISAGIEVAGAGAAAVSDFYSSGHAILTAYDHPVPEPATCLLIGAGLIGLGAARRKPGKFSGRCSKSRPERVSRSVRAILRTISSVTIVASD